MYTYTYILFTSGVNLTRAPSNALSRGRETRLDIETGWKNSSEPNLYLTQG